MTEQVPAVHHFARRDGIWRIERRGRRHLLAWTKRRECPPDGAYRRHPQYAGIFGHPISDAYQTLLADRVEVLRGPASVLYGSNAMGGVVNIVTRRMHEDGVRTDLHIGYGSYNTLETELTNRIRKGRFSGVVSGSYNRTDGIVPT